MRRRSLLAAPVAASVAALSAQAVPPDAGTSQPATADRRVYAVGDGIPYSPEEYAHLLTKLTANGAIEEDEFSRGGVVEKLEKRMAAMLGKETAVWLPTGTLANHLAVRALAGSRRRVIVQAESHLFNDCGDCAQTLSGLHLLPLAAGQATFTLDDVQRVWNSSQLGRVATPIGAIHIETPVRRRAGERFDYNQMAKITAWARERGVGLHLDGARLPIDASYSERPLREYTALFDTVYVSMYKYFNAAAGAILAGPKALLAELYHTRRMFGGSLQQAWPMAAVALHHADTFEATFARARQTGEAVIAALSADPSFAVERIPNGTNIFRLKVLSVNPPIFQSRLEGAGVIARTPPQDQFTLQVNPTWNRMTAQEIVAAFRKALG